jgi:regulator of sigma E protease
MIANIYKILLGLIGLGVVVFVHELGHFLAARLMGIDVEAFSIGWGKPFFKKKIGSVEYRLGIFPLGGYCKMKGENEFEQAYNNNKEGQPAEKGSYFSVHPFRRAVTCFAGPFFNLLFAVLVLSVIWGLGVNVNTLGNRIILASEIVPGTSNPSDEAGLKTGDYIIEIKGKETKFFGEIQEIIATHPGEELPIQVRRDDRILSLVVRPLMEKSSGAGKIGVYSWIDPLIEQIKTGSPAEIAGLKSGDRIIQVNGIELRNTMDLLKILDDRPAVLALELLRGNQTLTASLIPIHNEDGTQDLGIAWVAIRYRTPVLPLHLALVKGAAETWKTFALSVKSLSLLFKGVDLTQAVSGPIRITYMVGDIATESFNQQGIGAGISSVANFLSLISIALCIMNLLPLPILDGGMILLFLVEGIRRKPLNPKFISAFQAFGVIIIAGLMLFAVFGDVMFLSRQ